MKEVKRKVVERPIRDYRERYGVSERGRLDTYLALIGGTSFLIKPRRRFAIFCQLQIFLIFSTGTFW